MLIDFIEPVYPVDEYASEAFVEILNIILLSEHAAQLNKLLLSRNWGLRYRKLTGYFRWTFNDYSFTLWQRTAYESDVCFNHKVLELKFYVLIKGERKRANEIIH